MLLFENIDFGQAGIPAGKANARLAKARDSKLEVRMMMICRNTLSKGSSVCSSCRMMRFDLVFSKGASAGTSTASRRNPASIIYPESRGGAEEAYDAYRNRTPQHRITGTLRSVLAHFTTLIQEHVRLGSYKCVRIAG
jgi:hypothetical protein